MGVLLTIVAIAISGSAGVAAERRWPATAVGWARRALVISLYTLIPFVVFFNLARTHINADEAGGLVIGWVALLAASGIAWLVGTRLLRLDRPATGSLITATLIANSGYLGYPLCRIAARLPRARRGRRLRRRRLVARAAPARLRHRCGLRHQGRRGIPATGWSPSSPGTRRSTPRSPGCSSPTRFAPDVLVDISRGFVIALLPIGFFAVGAVLAEEVGRAARARSARPSILRSVPRSCCGFVVAPGLLLLLSLPFIDLPGPYLLLAAMPCGINTLLVAHVYGLDSKLAAQAVAWTTAIAVVAVLIAQSIWG